MKGSNWSTSYMFTSKYQALLDIQEQLWNHLAQQLPMYVKLYSCSNVFQFFIVLNLTTESTYSTFILACKMKCLKILKILFKKDVLHKDYKIIFAQQYVLCASSCTHEIMFFGFSLFWALLHNLHTIHSSKLQISVCNLEQTLLTHKKTRLEQKHMQITLLQFT